MSTSQEAANNVAIEWRGHVLFLLLSCHMLQAKEDALQRELYTTRLALIQQVCHHCSHTNAERPDDVVSDITSKSFWS